MVPNPAAAIALMAYFVAIGALLLYRKDGARHRQHVSLMAWGVLVILGGSAIELMLNSKGVSLFEAGRAALLAMFIVLSRGNVARLLWSEK
ncbi:phage holin family protein [Pseudoduganella dura]|uniref:phage holin family protein n=1 Tax=Pseudoduganella dura TaxID=321982 RepID=UPI00198E8058|nr:phage holin family protein [Pseudoduganella dura]GGY12667.1 membrane protein [Pseudoduganella dura]